MPPAPPNWISLLIAKLCHDLASPLGAMGLGIEILESNPRDQETFQTLKESHQNALIRLKLYQLVFSENPSAGEVCSFLQRLCHLKNVKLQQHGNFPSPPSLLNIITALAYLSVETLINGGTLDLHFDGLHTRFHAYGPRVLWNPSLLKILMDPVVDEKAWETRTAFMGYVRYQCQRINKKIDYHAPDVHTFTLTLL